MKGQNHYDKEKVATAFTLLTQGKDFGGSVANAVMLLAFIIDSGYKPEPGNKRKFTATASADSLSASYRFSVEELEGA